MQKIAIVTGGAKGIGQATVRLFSQNDYKVFVLDIEEPKHKYKNTNYIYCDVANISSINKAIQEIISKQKHIDVLVSNAGIHLSANIEDTMEEDYQKILDINFKGCFFTIKAVLPYMRRQKSGSIVIVGSDQSIIGKPNSAIYGATKAAIAQLAKNIAIDYAQYKIRANCVCVGTTDTPLYRTAIKKYHQKTGIPIAQIEKEEAALQPMNRVGKPQEIANLIYFLCEKQASFITGGLYPIDGGYTSQ